MILRYIVIPILAVLCLPQQARSEGESVNDAPPAKAAKWVAPQADVAKAVNEKNDHPVRVRIGLRLTPFKKMASRGQDGQSATHYLPMEPLRHTLRARLNKPNHFFVGDYHVETKPLKWVRKSRRYEVQLDLYRRYGAFGQLEEFVGSVSLNGVLEEQEDNVFVLLGTARQRFRDKFGNPVIDLVAGFQPGAPAPTGPELTQSEATTRAPVEPPRETPGPIIRGRF